jgi:DNA-binding NtrC family response regulator
MPDDSSLTVLLVEDEPALLATYELWLDDEYDVRTAGDGDEALAALDETVDVVVLDRRMPGVSGDEALAEMRLRGYSGMVAIVTAVEPDVDIVDMPFDTYLTKPVRREELLDLVDRLGEVATRPRHSRDLFAVVEKRTTLERELPRSALSDSEEYRRLVERHEELSQRVEAAIDRVAAAEAGPGTSPAADATEPTEGGGRPAPDPTTETASPTAPEPNSAATGNSRDDG